MAYPFTLSVSHKTTHNHSYYNGYGKFFYNGISI